ncbi:MAG: TetR/AcrR family transcriptional regulator [Eubacteriales bacterium]|nr:TetR/AcrR family transcriptional regulator [Eubacteriales bacterium]
MNKIDVTKYSEVYVSYSSEQTRQRIIESAKKEFLDKGFSGASMRSIASNSKATTGALYNYYKNKEDLFAAVVKETTDTFLKIYEDTHKFPLSDESEDDYNKNTNKILSYLYDHFTEFKIIFCCSGGTEYENYSDRLIEIEESAYRKILGAQAEADAFFLHVICGDGLRDLQELVAHDVPRNQAEAYMEKLERFRHAGWREVIGR